VVAFYKFLKQHASIPFKLQKPTSTPKPEGSDVKESSDAKETQSSNSGVKDEL
jgi:protein disulfide-isomerase A1